MSLQASGMLVGSLVAGQLSDTFGRKRPYFAGIIIVIVFNFIGFMSSNWIMFAVSRFFIGIGAGDFISVQHCILSEFMSAKWRPWITGFPSWPLQVCALALVSWLIKDWRYIQLFCCLLGIPFLFTWFVIPESFRWFVAHDRPADAQKIIEQWAKINNKPVPEVGNTVIIEKESTKEMDKKYTFIHLFKSKELTKITLLLAINWHVYYPVFFSCIFVISNDRLSFTYVNLFHCKSYFMFKHVFKTGSLNQTRNVTSYFINKRSGRQSDT
ncbi:solute carrier family 22 member 4-like [Ruditapes philippinarum]|uniref:solute carrier family 22 member 4-like n=1 Tax=Ruditapes philippinarum TaxID=129788 RepID=UPI00295B8195|nr:solute carrier family 22 member 4-like [Ruditapes philippinarum]